MTRQEALAFLDRNPKARKAIEALREVETPMERFWCFGVASNEEDANQDLLEVGRAAGLLKD